MLRLTLASFVLEAARAAQWGKASAAAALTNRFLELLQSSFFGLIFLGIAEFFDLSLNLLARAF